MKISCLIFIKKSESFSLQWSISPGTRYMWAAFKKWHLIYQLNVYTSDRIRVKFIS